MNQRLQRHISAPEVLVEAHRKLGAMVPRAEAAGYISAHIGEGQIRVADRGFTSFVVVCARREKRFEMSGGEGL